MTNNNKIIGKWSIDIMYAPGGQEDTFIVFLENGLGWIEYINFACRDLETFNWNLVDDNSINMVGIESYESDEGYSDSSMNYRNLQYDIKLEETPSGLKMETITFSEPVWAYECKFGLETRKIENINVPKGE